MCWEPKLPETFLPEIFKLSTLVVTNRTDAQDRWGGRCGVDIYGVRLGERCVLISHFPDIGNSDSPAETEIERLVPLHEVMRRAVEVFQRYYQSLRPKLHIKSGDKLSDKAAEVGAVLDKNYVPTDDVKATLPSSILQQIAHADVAECPEKWAWFNHTLYLTQCTFRRTALCNGRDFFDDSLALLFGGLKFRTHKVRLCTSKGPATFWRLVKSDTSPLLQLKALPPNFRTLVEWSLSFQRRDELAHLIYVANYDLQELTRQSNELLGKIASLEAELKSLALPD
jgi:hypothetical protein